MKIHCSLQIWTNLNVSAICCLCSHLLIYLSTGSVFLSFSFQSVAYSSYHKGTIWKSSRSQVRYVLWMLNMRLCKIVLCHILARCKPLQTKHCQFHENLYKQSNLFSEDCMKTPFTVTSAKDKDSTYKQNKHIRFTCNTIQLKCIARQTVGFHLAGNYCIQCLYYNANWNEFHM